MMKEGEWQFARTICEDGSDPVGANCYSPLFFRKIPIIGANGNSPLRGVPRPLWCINPCVTQNFCPRQTSPDFYNG